MKDELYLAYPVHPVRYFFSDGKIEFAWGSSPTCRRDFRTAFCLAQVCAVEEEVLAQLFVILVSLVEGEDRVTGYKDFIGLEPAFFVVDPVALFLLLRDQLLCKFEVPVVF